MSDHYEKLFNDDGTVTLRFFDGGVVVDIQQISAMAIQTIQTSGVGKPQPPWVEIPKKSGMKRRERNPDDPAYLEALKTWKTERTTKLMQYVLCNGVASEPPEGFEESVADFIDIDNPNEVKMMWLSSILNNDQMNELMGAITDLTNPSEEGIDASTDTFQRDGELTGHSEVPVQE